MATRPTVGGSDGTWGTELNAHLDISLDNDGKVDDGASQTTSAAPTADAELANKLYADTKESKIITQSTPSLLGTRTINDDTPAALAVDTVYKVTGDGEVSGWLITAGADCDIYADSSDGLTTRIQRHNVGAGSLANFSFFVNKDDFWRVVVSSGAGTIFWLPFGTGVCQDQS